MHTSMYINYMHICTGCTINSCNIGTSALPDMYARCPRHLMGLIVGMNFN